MENLLILVSFYSLALISFAAQLDQSNIQTYIVHVEPAPPNGHTLLANSKDIDSAWYRSFLPTTIASSRDNKSPLIYSYHNVFKGFAARLSADQVKEMEKKEGFISAKPEQVMYLHTTHSPNFLGLQQNFGFWKASNYGRGVIIGLLDTGVNPNHPSFSDEGMPPPPAKWKGRCDFNFTACNNKLIGARYFSSARGTPLDEMGHGTHTASTAAGNFVTGANVFGNANGTASGIAPLAHLAMYKVCATAYCSESDMLAVMDAAIEDGVDVISISLGSLNSNTFYDDNIAMGAFSAIEKGIFVSCSAGNSGPNEGSLSNEAPWVLTVGASTIDRRIRATVVLGNNEELHGESVFQPIGGFPLTQLPIALPGYQHGSSFCDESLSKINVRGKIVVCAIGGGLPNEEKVQAVKRAGGVAMILVNNIYMGETIITEALNFPVTHLNFEDGERIVNYVFNNASNISTASIKFSGTIIGDVRAPAVAAFSSRGPNLRSPGILKPDIIGPGVNILAAWPFSVENKKNVTKSTFNIISGTSMSCPHLSGVAALLKSSHPDWSPAAIKSSIITTANVVNLENKQFQDDYANRPATIFATGSGHVNPSKANDPGLVYDILPEDYVPYLCGLNYTNKQVEMILHRQVNCSDIIPEAQLNYPSFSIILKSTTPQTYSRTITNVGEVSETYKLQVVSPAGINVTVEPSTLSFIKLNQKLSYKVTFHRLDNSSNDTYVQGSVIWNSDKHLVRTPIAINLV